MDFHNPIDEIIGNCILVPNILATATVIYLSVRRVKSSLMQKYALNLCIPSFAFSIYSITVFLLKFVNKSEDVTIEMKVKENSFLDRTADFILYVCAYDYQMLVILLVAITYATFAKPMYVNSHIGGWLIHALFFACHFSSILLSIASMTSEDQAESIVYGMVPDTKGFEWTDILEAVFFLTSFAVLFSLYIVCIIAIIGFNRRNSILTKKTKDPRPIKTQLLVILAYITPPNVFVIPTSFCIDLLAVLLDKNTPVFAQVCYGKIVLHDTLMAIRLFISCAGILIAFPDYRNALSQMFGQRQTFNRVVRTISDQSRSP